MRRREVLAICGAAVAWPWASSASSRRRIGIMMVNADTDPEGQVRVKAFLQELEKAGWSETQTTRLSWCQSASLVLTRWTW
jgi:putative ABC transport system substrate-binding protein